MKVPKEVKEKLAAIPPLLFDMASTEVAQAEELTTKSLELQKAIEKMEVEEE